MITYYGVPLSFINSNFFIAFVILNLILVMIIIGLTFMCSLIFNYGERLILWILMTTCCRRDKRLYSIISKQMNAHQVRNNKTSIMLTLSVAFLFFSASSFELISTLVQKSFDKIIGADMFINAVFGVLDEGPLANYLTEQQTTGDRPVEDFVFVSLDMKSALELGDPAGSASYLRPPSRHSSNEYPFEARLYAVPENYFDVVDNSFYVPNEL